MLRSHQAKRASDAKVNVMSLSLLLEWLHNPFKQNRFLFRLVWMVLCSLLISIEETSLLLFAFAWCERTIIGPLTLLGQILLRNFEAELKLKLLQLDIPPHRGLTDCYTLTSQLGTHLRTRNTPENSPNLGVRVLSSECHHLMMMRSVVTLI